MRIGRCAIIFGGSPLTGTEISGPPISERQVAHFTSRVRAVRKHLELAGSPPNQQSRSSAEPVTQRTQSHPSTSAEGATTQCDKENHGWRKGPPLTAPGKVSICWPGLHPPSKISSERKENTPLRPWPRAPQSEHLPV